LTTSLTSILLVIAIVKATAIAREPMFSSTSPVKATDGLVQATAAAMMMGLRKATIVSVAAMYGRST
jgi:hypothetical protein